MSIASRLYNILRAELQDRASGSRFSAASPIEDRPLEDPPPEEASAEAHPGRDPDLARWYANLEIPYGSDLDAVQAARKKLARKYHPDRHSADPDLQQTATELLKGINEAYEQLRRRLEP